MDVTAILTRGGEKTDRETRNSASRVHYARFHYVLDVIDIFEALTGYDRAAAIKQWRGRGDNL